MVAVATIAPGPDAGAVHRRGRSTLLVGPGVGGDRLASALGQRWGACRPASVHVVAIDTSRTLWTTWAEWDLCLVGGVWDLYEESWSGQQRSRARRRAELEASLAEIVPSVTHETFLGPLRSALLQAPARWPGCDLLAVGRWRRLPRRLRPWPDGIELLSL